MQCCKNHVQHRGSGGHHRLKKGAAQLRMQRRPVSRTRALFCTLEGRLSCARLWPGSGQSAGGGAVACPCNMNAAPRSLREKGSASEICGVTPQTFRCKIQAGYRRLPPVIAARRNWSGLCQPPKRNPARAAGLERMERRAQCAEWPMRGGAVGNWASFCEQSPHTWHA
jgi:hypothetical protein